MINSTISVSAKSWYTANKVIRHAGGKIGNSAYTNSEEAVTKSLERGNKVIEMDFTFTSDNILVCRHDWKEVSDKSYETFINTPIAGKYTPLTAEDFLFMVDAEDDIYVVVDAKEKDVTTVYREIVRLCKENEQTDLLKRIIPQIYRPSEYSKIKKIYNFKNWIFTVYVLKPKKSSDYRKIAKFCKQNKIKVVTIPQSYITTERLHIIKQYGLKCFTHTINSNKKYLKLKKHGVDGIYSDSL